MPYAEVALQIAQGATSASALRAGVRCPPAAAASHSASSPPTAPRRRPSARPPRGDLFVRGVGREARVARQRAPRARVDVLHSEAVRARPLLELGHRGDELQLRAAVNVRRGERAREPPPARPQQRQRDGPRLREHPEHGRPREEGERAAPAPAARALMILVERDEAVGYPADDVDGELQFVARLMPRCETT